jgi:5-methylcytosine-specific restriction endonuclease McrA
MKVRENKYGYYQVILSNNGKSKTITIHQLVARAFIDNPENKKEVNHKDGNKLNNNINNLEWATNIENKRHAIKNGLIDQKGEKNYKAKLKDKDIPNIHKLLAKEVSQKIIAKKYNVSSSTISYINKGNTWKHIKNTQKPIKRLKYGEADNPSGQECQNCGEVIKCKSRRQWNMMKQYPNKKYFCDRKCFAESMMDVKEVPDLFCSECGDKLNITRKQYGVKKFRSQKNHFCSYKCMSKYNSEKRKVPLEVRREKWGKYNRNGWELKRLRDRLKKERGDKCEACGSAERVVMHHIKPIKLYPELGYDENNLVLLCGECHTEIHLKTDWNYLKGVEEKTVEVLENVI